MGPGAGGERSCWAQKKRIGRGSRGVEKGERATGTPKKERRVSAEDAAGREAARAGARVAHGGNYPRPSKYMDDAVNPTPEVVAAEIGLREAVERLRIARDRAAGRKPTAPNSAKLSEARVAAALGVWPSAVRSWARGKLIPCVPVPGGNVFDLGEVRKALKLRLAFDPSGPHGTVRLVTVDAACEHLGWSRKVIQERIIDVARVPMFVHGAQRLIHMQTLGAVAAREYGWPTGYREVEARALKEIAKAAPGASLTGESDEADAAAGGGV